MYALVTGASSGIGLEYAKELARRGHDVILVSNQEAELATAQELIQNEFKVKAENVCMDLARSEAAEELYNKCKSEGWEVEILINDAGVFFFNPLVETAMKRIDVMLQLHVTTVCKLCRLFGEDMKNRKSGYILNMSSLSAWMTFPGITVYESTKEFIRTFSKGFHYEMKVYNVGVTAICPGAVNTGLYGLSDYWRKIAVGIGVSITPDKLARKAINKMFKKKKEYIPGAINHVFLPIVKHFPDFLIMFIISKISQFQK